jgi:hypothetical protein
MGFVLIDLPGNIWLNNIMNTPFSTHSEIDYNILQVGIVCLVFHCNFHSELPKAQAGGYIWAGSKMIH